MNRKDEPRIFIVEDNLLYQQLIAKELESISGDIYFFTRGESCLEELDKKPEVVVLDYNLEGEINGLDTLKEIRKISESIFIVIFSSRKNLNSPRNRNRYGTFTYLEKKLKSFGKLKKTIQSGYLEIP